MLFLASDKRPIRINFLKENIIGYYYNNQNTKISRISSKDKDINK